MITKSSQQLNNFFLELQNQGTEPGTNNSESHPDPSMRRFYRAFARYLSANPDYVQQLEKIIKKRTNLTPSHFVSLLPRAAQYLLRKKNIDTYINYSEDDWIRQVMPWLTADKEFITILNKYNNSTTRPRLRYKALAALAAGLNSKPIIVYDIGCSLNLGLPSVIEGKLIQDNKALEFIDRTPNQLILQLLTKNKVSFAAAYGIDKQNFRKPHNFEWVTACARFEEYDHIKQQLIKDYEFLQAHNKQCTFITADIADKDFLDKIQKIEKKRIKALRIIHASMVFYQLTKSELNQAFNNMNHMLNEHDIVIELCYKSPDAQFRSYNIVSNIYIKQKNKLQGPYKWLLWKDAYCKEVKPGKDFQFINNMLNLAK